MSGYLGLDPRFLTNARDYFAGTGSQTNFTLTSAPGGADGILVSVNGLILKSKIAYSVVGKALNFTQAPPVPSNGDTYNIEVIYLQRMGSVQAANWTIPIATASGTDSIVATYYPNITAYTNNLYLYAVLPGQNTTTTPTFNANGVGAKPIVNYDGTAVPIGTLLGTVALRYDSATDKFWMAITPVLNSNAALRSDIQNQVVTAFATAGTSPTFTVTTAPAYGAYAANQRFRIKFHAAGTTGSNTLNRDGLGVKSLKQYDYTGTKVDGVVTAGLLTDIEYDGTDFVILDPLPVVGIVATGDYTANSFHTRGATNALYFNDRNTDANGWALYSASNICRISINGSDKVSIDASGNMSVVGNVTGLSDETFKTNWRSLGDNYVSELAKVKYGIYDRTDVDGLTQVGVSAQSLQKVLPDAVLESEGGTLSVAYGNAAMVSCVALAAEVEALKAKLKEMEDRLEKLEI